MSSAKTVLKIDLVSGAQKEYSMPEHASLKLNTQEKLHFLQFFLCYDVSVKKYFDFLTLVSCYKVYKTF